MTYSENTSLSVLLKDERAKAILERHMPGATTHPMLHMALSMSIKEISWYPEAGLSAGKLKEIVADLQLLG